MNDERLQAAWRSLSRDAAPRPDCPDAERILAAVEGALGAGETRDIVEHTVTCASCAEAWRLAREVVREPRVTAEWGDGSGAALERGAVRRRIAIAATLVLGLLAIWLYRTRLPQDGTIIRGQVDGLASPAHEATLPRTDFRLTWEGGSEDTLYDLTVSTADLVEVDRAEGLVTSEYLVPADSLAALPAGTKIVWRVEEVGGRGLEGTFVTELVDETEPP